MKTSRRPLSLLLSALLVAQLLLSYAPAHAEEPAAQEGVATTASEPALPADKGVDAGAAADEGIWSDARQIEPTSGDASAPADGSAAQEGASVVEKSEGVQSLRAPAPAPQPAIEASVVSSNGKETYGTLSDPKASLSLSKGTRFNLHVHAVFPSAANKTIEVALPYGMQWNTDFKFDKTLGWVGELQADGVTAPSQQTDATKKPVSVYGWPTAGTLTLRFQDTTQEVEFDLPMGLAFNFNPGLASIPDAITLTQGYVEEGKAPVANTLGTDVGVTNLPSLNNIGFASDYAKLLNGSGNVEIGEDSPTGTGHDIAWRASFGPGDEKHMLEDYYVAMLAPEKAVYLGRYSGDGDYGVKEADLKVLNPGEHFTLSTGDVYTVPEGKKLYVWQRTEAATIPVAGHATLFNPMWRFPKADFPAGTVAEISQIDVGAKFYSPYGTSSYLPYDAKKLRTMRYEIVEPKEDVYVNTTMYGSGQDWPLWEGYIADNEVYLGAPGYEHTQERTLGYFTVGNRGTADSKPKTIIIDYDVNNTKIAGVTAQALPFISRAKADGTQPTQVSDFKVTLWNSKTGETFERAVDKPKQRFRVEDAWGSHEDGIYIKHIEYKINTIPAKTALNAYYNNQYTGAEDFQGESTSFGFYGNVLTNDVRERGKWGDDPSLFKTRIRIENTGEEEPDWHHRNQDKWDFGDGKGEVVLKYPARSYDHVTIGDTFTAFTGKSFIQGHGPVYQWHEGNPMTYVVGDQINDKSFSYFDPFWWNGSSQGQQTYKAIYYISPMGDDLSFQMTYRPVGSKDYWNLDGADGDHISAKQPDVYEVPASDALKATYPNAKVYKLDFSKYTSVQDVYDTRATGPLVYWRESSRYVPYSINATYWAYTVDTIVRVSFASDPEKDVPGTYSQLMWYEYDTDTNEELVYSSNGFAKDKWDLNGNGSTEDLLGHPMGSWKVKSPTDLVVRSAAKMATQPDSQYVTYDGISKTGIGANSTVDYRLIASNPTQGDAQGFKVYWPVPKKDQNWGKAIQPKGAFQFDMFLNSGIKSGLPEGYKVYYAKNVTPTSQALDWDGFDWTEEADTASWTQADWDAVNFVRIESPEGSTFSAKQREEFRFNLTLRDIPPEDFDKELLDVFTPTYLRDLGSGKGYRYGQPIAMTPLPGTLAGTAWVDADYDGVMDDSEASDLIAGMKIELYDNHGRLVDTAVTDPKGHYLFKGLKAWKDGATSGLDAYSIKAYNPTNPLDVTAPSRFVRFSPAGTDMVLAAAADHKTASIDGVTVASTNAGKLNIGLVRATKVDVEKKWVEGANADGSDGTGISHEAVGVRLLEDGVPARDIDGNAVAPIGLAAGSWAGSFENLLVNDSATNAPAVYSVEEGPVPEGYVASYEYKTNDNHLVATISNTRIHGTIKVTKVDAADGSRALPNTEFQLRQDGRVVREGTTGKDGTVSFSDVPYGDYEVVESVAPEGYVSDPTPHAASIATQGQVVALTVGNTGIKGSISVTKSDATDDARLLPKAVFQLRQGDAVIAEGETDDKGVCSFNDVAYGDYTLVEAKAPEGYVLDTTPMPVQICENGATVALVVKDRMIAGSLVVSKVDAADAGKVLSGATFELRRDGRAVQTRETGDDGTATFPDPPYGDYQLVETRAPEGYVLDSTPQLARICKDGEVTKLTVKDVAKPEVPKAKASKPVLPQTGDAAPGLVGIAATGIAALMLGLLRRRRDT